MDLLPSSSMPASLVTRLSVVRITANYITDHVLLLLLLFSFELIHIEVIAYTAYCS